MFKILFLILVVMSSTIFAQQTENNVQKEKPKSILFDEFGKISQKELKLRTERLRKKLEEKTSKEEGLRAYLIFYTDDKTPSLKKTQEFIRDVLFDKCYDCYGFGGPHLVFVEGGKLNEQKIQFWLSPRGAELPEMLNNDNSNFLPKAQKMDTFGNVSGRYFFTALDKFVEKLNQDKTLKGVVINYSGARENEQKSFAVMEEKIKGYPKLNELLSEDRITFLRGKEKDFQRTELWIVPEDAESPTPEN